MICAAQVRAARALLNWSQTELALRAAVDRKTLFSLESERRAAHEPTVSAIQRALEDAGVIFVDTAAGAGVLLKTEAALQASE